MECYVSPSGNNKIAEWYGRLSAQERADTDEFIKYMRRTSKWVMPDYLPALNGHPKLGELRWKSCNKQHRLVGFRKDGTFFAVMGCTHKQQIYAPRDALETADKRRSDILNNTVTTVAYDL